MKVLLVGGGAREHALAWQISHSHKCTGLYCAPGNAGIAEIAECVAIAADNVQELVSFARSSNVDLVVVGPEAPLVAGLADKLAEAGIKVFGPSAAAARLEGSKRFMKDLCAKYGVPTAAYGCFDNVGAALAFIAQQEAPLVVKADGLAAGKGVIICQTREEAERAVREMLEGGRFGAAGAEVVIEAFLDGEELSYFAIADGKTVLPLTSAQDHKRAYDGDQGPNTGGMGAYSPAHMMTDELERKIQKTIIAPVIAAMEQEGCSFTGVLFAGIMLVGGEPYVLEFNARFGDPECEPIMMRLETDLLEILAAAAEGKLARLRDDIYWRSKTALCVVMASQGYPGAYETGSVIRGLEEAEKIDNVKIFHAGTARNETRELISSGGRVLAVTALAENAGLAQSLAYEAIARIDWPEGFYRRDIGFRAVESERGKAVA